MVILAVPVVVLCVFIIIRKGQRIYKTDRQAAVSEPERNRSLDTVESDGAIPTHSLDERETLLHHRHARGGNG